MSNTARILELIRDTTQRHGDLISAFQASDIPGAQHVAERLTAGATLPTALHGVIPVRLATLLAGGLPPLSTVASLLTDEAWRAAERRRLLFDHLAYPLSSAILVLGLALCIAVMIPHGRWYAPLASSAWAIPPFICAMLLMIAPWTPRRFKLPGSGWAKHFDLASQWARAALAVQWRLTEAQAVQYLGTDLRPVTLVLGAPDAETHCRMLADWHRRVAQRRLVLTAYIAAACILAAGGGIILGAARIWTAAPVT